MIFNTTDNYQVTTRLTVNNVLLDIISETDLLGVVISSDLTWRSNTKLLVQRAYKRIILLHKLFEFAVPEKDLVTIYVLFIRSILEQSCVVWHSAITKEEEVSLERVQKVILKQEYNNYDDALKRTNLQTLVDRREKLCLNFALKCTTHEKNKEMFPLNKTNHSMSSSMRHQEKYEVQFSRTTRLGKSAIPYLQRLLNQHSK